MKTVLIISPSFPPVNAADMHRVRQSVRYFEEFGYRPIVMAVKPTANENGKDELLTETLPKNLEIIWVNAFATRWTRKIGLGALGIRSLYYYWMAGNRLLKTRKVDIIYFSTTMFPVLILGAYWKNRFGISYIIDMQDPWHSTYYQDKPKHERPAKYWFSYRLNKFLEPIAMTKVSGIIAVSQGYCDMLQSRYSNITPANCTVIPFGAFDKDFEVLKSANQHHKTNTFLTTNKTNILYIGRGGADMAQSLTIIFEAFKIGLKNDAELFSKIVFNFIGTSYASGSSGQKSIQPIAQKMEISEFVMEQTGRIPYFDSLQLLLQADILLIPGSNDPNYTASKLYPYIMACKPILAVFSATSSVIDILKETNSGEYVGVDFSNIDNFQIKSNELYQKWKSMLEKLPYQPATNWSAFEQYTAKQMTRKQVEFFDKTP